MPGNADNSGDNDGAPQRSGQDQGWGEGAAHAQAVRLWVAHAEHGLGEVAQMVDRRKVVWRSFVNVG